MNEKNKKFALILLVVAILCILTAIIAAIVVSGGDDEVEVEPTVLPTATAAPTAVVPATIEILTPDTPIPVSPGIYETIESPAVESTPQPVGETGLILRSILNYSGKFVEDGSDEQVSDIFAILLYNDSGSDIEYATLEYSTADGRLLTFTFSNLPKNRAIVVLEANRAVYAETELTLISEVIAPMETMQLMTDRISRYDGGNNDMVFTNISDETVENLRFYYKYLYDSETLLGGITYSCTVGELGAGMTISVSPSRYVSGGCEIMQIRDAGVSE
ncbi:MAG: hypothetical protein Q4C01_05340 [Clostridia bacterium]|nr:hypothetical protein [Clostridia bacterium]